ncbi:MAG TPA: ribose-5-phosphate isomerase RpiA [Solirubrobacteraceae bacterium]|nr:ribose-5-phosphate isomerase RpiA [Solirubrobacteraceae bacterium]
MASHRAPEALPPLSGQDVERLKRDAARASAELVHDGMRVGLGTGSTVAHLLAALGERAAELRSARFAATSPATAEIARSLGLHVEDLDALGELELAIDGADQVDPDGWLVKGGGGAHTREKIVAAAAQRFVVIVSANKLVAEIRPPVPLELLRFGVGRTLQELGHARLREGDAGPRQSPEGNLIGDYTGPVRDPATLAARLSATPGVVEHGLFAPTMVSEIIAAGPAGLTRRLGAKPAT